MFFLNTQDVLKSSSQSIAVVRKSIKRTKLAEEADQEKYRQKNKEK